MSFHEQDRSGGVTPRFAKGLARSAQRCFATLSMTCPVLGFIIAQIRTEQTLSRALKFIRAARYFKYQGNEQARTVGSATT